MIPYIKFKSRHNKPMVLKVKVIVIWGEVDDEWAEQMLSRGF